MRLLSSQRDNMKLNSLMCVFVALLLAAATQLSAQQTASPSETITTNKSATNVLIQLYIMGAEHGEAEAEYRLGLAYENGQGVETNIVAAVKWYRKAAELGRADAQRQLGRLYAWGRKDVTQDPVEAEKWLRRSAEQGDIGAQHELGFLYRYGIGGVRTNYAEAAKWWSKAGEQGDSKAQWLSSSQWPRSSAGLQRSCEMVS